MFDVEHPTSNICDLYVVQSHSGSLALCEPTAHQCHQKPAGDMNIFHQWQHQQENTQKMMKRIKSPDHFFREVDLNNTVVKLN